MPFSSPKRKISDTENKLRVLYCLNALGMATLDELWPFAAKLELMEYMPLCLFVDELRSDGAITSGSHALEGVLYLTEAGRQQLNLFAGKLLATDKERITQAAPAYRDELRARKQVRAAYERSPEGCCSASLTLREGDVPTLFLRIFSPNQRLVEKAVRGFQNCAPLVLNLLYTLEITHGECPVPQPLPQEAAIASAACGKPALCAFGGREHAAVVQLSNEDARYTVLLLFPDEALARSWACSADASSRELAAALTALFSDAAEAEA